MLSLLVRAAAACFLLTSIAVAAGDAQKVGNVDISQWRGFNLLEKFTLNQNAPYKEDDFKWIAELGFNFVRLPTDYRCYVEKDDWLKFKEPVLKEIDDAIALGEKYKIHVCLNLHRAPGFCINPPEEKTNLWKDEDALNAYIAHWVMFAKRYKHVPPERLSFNLLNEPTRNTQEQYLKVFCRTIEAIQKEDPKRLIMVDGNNVGGRPTPEFLKYQNVIQATRGYHPGTVSHYKASWAKGSDKWPEPVWPPGVRVPGHLYAPTSDPAKKGFASALVLRGNFKAGTEFALKILQVSAKAKLAAKAGGSVVAEKVYDPKADPNEWKAVKPDQWTYHEPVADLEFKVVLPAAAKEVSIENVEGDWLTFSQLSIQPPGGRRQSCGTDLAWGLKQTARDVAADGAVVPPPGTVPEQTLINYLKPWLEISAQGAPVFVGEWGCYNKTPHAVALAWMKSWLEQWKKARLGWALWNFRGSFGILDSGRSDVPYEDWHGHKLDRDMLKLLQEYQKY